jgi:GAF domain-containing protein
VIFLDYEIAENTIKQIASMGQGTHVLQNVVTYLYDNFDKYSWIGIYIVNGDDLILGPWKGDQATEHVRIPIGKGICGSAAASGRTEIISDVNADDRYLACFVSTKSEIVVPIKKYGKTIGEIDIDSDKKDAFTSTDKVFLEKIADMLCQHI